VLGQVDLRRIGQAGGLGGEAGGEFGGAHDDTLPTRI
jgi:hypothetical protein